MVAKSPRLNVTRSPVAISSLDAIWDWNAKTYGVNHANQYIDFLRAETRKLATDYPLGKRMPSYPGLLYVLIRRRRKGYGHIIVYRVKDETVHVLNYFHTAQDWQRHLLDLDDA
jgi:plasmid stabilization system protein ParE